MTGGSTVGGMISPAEVLARAQYWTTHPPPTGYDQGNSTADPDGKFYRSDCSGFVSMCWHLTGSLDTASIAAGGAVQIDPADLQPGDAICASSALNGGSGHVVLFDHWVSGHSSYWGHEFGEGASPQHHEIPYPYFSNDSRTYLAYHYPNLGGTYVPPPYDPGGGGGGSALTWSLTSLPSPAGWIDVTYGAGRFVALGVKVNNYGMPPDVPASCATSSDGTNWTASPIPDDSHIWGGIAYGNGVFVAVAYGFTASYVAAGTTTAATSPDGINWTIQSMPTTAPWHRVAFGNGTFVAIAERSASYATSPDGVNWTAGTLPGWGSPGAQPTIAFGGGLFITGTQQATTVLTSPDGANWTSHSVPDANLRTVTWGDSTFVAFSVATAATSPDGANWTSHPLPLSSSWQSAAGGGVIAAVPQSFFSQMDSVYSADHGVTWATLPLPFQIWTAICYGGGMFVAVAQRSATAACGVVGHTVPVGGGDLRPPAGDTGTTANRHVGFTIWMGHETFIYAELMAQPDPVPYNTYEWMQSYNDINDVGSPNLQMYYYAIWVPNGTKRIRQLWFDPTKIAPSRRYAASLRDIYNYLTDFERIAENTLEWLQSVNQIVDVDAPLPASVPVETGSNTYERAWPFTPIYPFIGEPVIPITCWHWTTRSSSALPPKRYLRMTQRNDGRGIDKHPRLEVSGVNEPTSKQSRSIRLGDTNTYR